MTAMPDNLRSPSPVTRAAKPRGFTLVELLISILIIGIILGLAVVSFRIATRGSRNVADRQSVLAIGNAVKQFKSDFGFIPPLVRDRGTPPVSIENVPGTTPAERRAAVYQPSFPAQAQFLNGSTVTPPFGPPASLGNNPFVDARFSERSLAYYLAGGLNLPLRASDGPAIDGVGGPGFARPNQDGSFQISADARSASTTSARVGTTYEPLLDLGSSVLKLFTDPAALERSEIRDRRDVAIRYYRWINGVETPAGSGRFVVESLDDLRVPRLVGRFPGQIPGPLNEERDITRNPRLREATFAIVAAGPDGLFGDETDLNVMRGRLGLPAGTDELQVRIQAERDNIVEVGS
jgi:prepilin-type N-terminal cleavage/methylation domain-containing protein